MGIHPNCHRFALFDPAEHMSHGKKTLTFHFAGCVIEILIMAYYNPHMAYEWVVQSPIYPKQPGFFIAQMVNDPCIEDMKLKHIDWKTL